MRELIERTVAKNWETGLDEGLGEACFMMTWNYEHDHDPDDEHGEIWLIQGHTIKTCVAGPEFWAVIQQLSDEALLLLLDRQLCLHYR